MTASRKRVLVIGLDGGTFDLIEPWAGQGYLPNLVRLIENGCHGPLTSTLQPTTAPAWVTFMTGVNQGKHGLYDFVRRKSDGYDLEVTSASQIAAPTIFDIASQHGLHVAAINVPYTSPPRSVNGLMIGGPFAPTVTRDLVSPPAYFDVLKEVVPDYFVLPDFEPRATDPLNNYATKLLKGIELRERLCLHVMQTEPWDLFTIVFMATDEAQHTYWHCQDAPKGTPLARYRHVIRDVYRRIDQAIGTILAQVAAENSEQETIVIILSDHGAGPFRWMINLNRWLADAGYLQFRTDRISPFKRLRANGLERLVYLYRQYMPVEMRATIRAKLGVRRFDQVKGDFESVLLTSNVAWDQTRAYALGSGGNIFINVKDREPAGIVEPGAEYERLRQELADSLMTLSDPETGRPVVQRVYQREELYHGPFLDQAPDLVIQWKDYAYWGRGRYSSHEAVFEAQRQLDSSAQPLTGSHRLEGILIAQGSGIQSKAQIQGAHLLDLAPTILSLLGIRPGLDMDGHLLQNILIEGELDHLRQVATGDDVITSNEQFEYSPEEEETISQHLRSLGYL